MENQFYKSGWLLSYYYNKKFDRNGKQVINYKRTSRLRCSSNIHASNNTPIPIHDSFLTDHTERRVFRTNETQCITLHDNVDKGGIPFTKVFQGLQRRMINMEPA